MPIKKGTVPVPPASPVVSVSKNNARWRSTPSSDGFQGQLRETFGRHVQGPGNRRLPVVMMRLEVLVDEVQLTVLGIARLPPAARLERSQHRAAVGSFAPIAPSFV